MTLFIEQRRGFAVEAEHAIDAVTCTQAGEVRVLSGSDALTTFRSAGKPFQLEASLGALPPALVATLTTEDVALGAASHHGEPRHMQALAALCGRLGVAVSDLYCGAHPPLHKESADALLVRGEAFTALHNNCAGKHAFMAAATRALGAPADYRPDEHSLQRRVRAVLDERLGHDAVAGTVIDGCGLPCFVLRLSAMARAYAQLGGAIDAGDGAPPAMRTLGSIGRAMRAAPWLVSGSEAFDGWLMQHAPVIAKVGALGLLCLAVPTHGIGLAVKVRTGSELVRPLAVQAMLDAALPGLLTAALPPRFHRVTNVVGAEVGALVTRSRPG